MAVPVTVPRLGLAAGEGLIAEWYKLDGASVDAGDLMYRIETDFASIDVEADESGVIRHAPGAEGVPTEGDVIAYLLAPDEASPGQDQPPEPQAQTPPRSSRAAASRAATPSPKAPRARGRSKVYPLKEVLEVAAVPPVEPAPPVPEGLPWDPFQASEPAPEEVFEAPKPLLLFPRIVNQLKEEAAVEAEEDDTAPEQPEASPESETREHFGWELSTWFQNYLDLEQSAELIRSYEIQFVPGLLQTDAYARAVIMLGHGGATTEEIDRRADLRMARKRMLTRPDPPRLWAVLDEAVLRRPIGGAAVLREQIESLLEATKLPSVRLQVIPFESGGHAAAGGAFSILRFPYPDMPDVVYIEHLTSGLYLDKREDVDQYLAAMGRLIIEAEPPARTPELLRKALRNLDEATRESDRKEPDDR
jgi:hypothetical protein